MGGSFEKSTAWKFRPTYPAPPGMSDSWPVSKTAWLATAEVRPDLKNLLFSEVGPDFFATWTPVEAVKPSGMPKVRQPLRPRSFPEPPQRPS